MPYKDPAKKLENAKRYRQEQRVAISARNKAYRSKNKEAIAEYQRVQNVKNKELRSEYIREYNLLPESKAKRAQRRKRQWAENPQYRLASRLRNRLWYALKGRPGKYSAISLLGCSVIEAVEHIENQFVDGMSWSNHGDWHIDHIIPLSVFNLEDAGQVAKACHYTNLRPLWASENLSKGSRIEPQQLLPTAGLAGCKACGDSAQSGRSVKQEPAEATTQELAHA